MPYIEVIPPSEAEGELADVYDEVTQRRGSVANVLQIQSLHPKGLVKHLELYMSHLYRSGGLRRYEAELIAVVVSSANGCAYCVKHHSDALLKYAKDEDLVKQIATDHAAADLSRQRRALADYAWGLTRNPAEGRKQAVEALREAGFDDNEILHATEIVAYFNYVNRLVHGLGVQVEDAELDYKY